MMADFHYSTDADGVATITWDVPGRTMNILRIEGFIELGNCINAAMSDDNVRGIVITSGKGSFSGGMDLAGFEELTRLGFRESPGAVLEQMMGIHRLRRGVETGEKAADEFEGRKPVVAAIPGTAVGIGFELPLACHRIICADKPDVGIGLPEIKVGLFPGAGGTTRLIRKLGLAAAGPWLFKGTLADPRTALSSGLVDEVVEPDRLLESARQWVLEASEEDLIKPWDRKGYRIPGGTPYDREGFESFVGAPVMINSRTFGVYPAAKACLSAIYEGSLVPFDTAIKIEARWFTSLLMEPSTASMIRTVFTDRKALGKGVRRPAGIEAQRIAQLGVVGAGMMGAGIAQVAAKAGMDVVLLDRDQDRANGGKERVAGMLERQAGRGGSSREAVRETLSRIRPSSVLSDLRGCELVIEAVFEDPKVKTGVIAEVAACAGSDCVIASNTSTLPINGLAKAALHAGNFLGMHFFSPVDRMMLVEIIRGSGTGDKAVARAIDFVRAIRKVPIIVNDARFFYANRCIIPYLNEGIRMVGEGVSPALVENAAKLMGMPVGPLQLVDETSIDLAANIAAATKSALGNDYVDGDVDRIIDFLVKKGRLGRKVGAGFYEYGPKGKRVGLWSGLAAEFRPLSPQPDIEEVKNRLLLIQVLEAVRSLEEGVLTDVREGDVGAVLGWGLAVWAGGPFSWLDMIGAAAAADLSHELSACHGPRFKAPRLLLTKAANGEKFTAGGATRSAGA